MKTDNSLHITLEAGEDKSCFKTQTLEEWKAQDNYYKSVLKTDHCNTAMGIILKERGIDLPANKSINQIIKFMEQSVHWQILPRTYNGRLDHQKANQLAQQGRTVVFGYYNPHGHGHGGVLTGNPNMFESKNFIDEKGNKIKVPEVQASIGPSDIKKQHLGYHLTSTHESHTNYYVYKDSVKS